MRKLVDLTLIREADAALDRIALEHPELIDHQAACWSAEEVARMVVEPNDPIPISRAAEIIGCHVETLRRAVRRGELKAARIGREYKVSKVDLQAYWIQKGGGELFDKDS